MATTADWIEGARLRTLPAAVAPVLSGSAVALFLGHLMPVRALLCLVVALALQVGVNFANDYSDGIRGTDAERVGPARLVGGGLAAPDTVKAAAFVCFGLACVAGLVLVVLTHAWWLVLVGIACVLAAWYYTGGKHPYGYAGWGEVFVFIFFGLVAVCGTTFVQTGAIPAASFWVAVGVGLWAVAILVANNLRDIDGDIAAGKRTLATRLGDRGTRAFWVAALVGANVALVLASALTTWWGLLGLMACVVVLPAARILVARGTGAVLIAVLRGTGIAQLVASAGYLVGVVVAMLS